jgi:hypothetical protein
MGRTLHPEVRWSAGASGHRGWAAPIATTHAVHFTAQPPMSPTQPICRQRNRARCSSASAGYESPARDWCAIDGVAGSRGDRVAGTHPARVGDWRAGRAERTILTTDERVARGMVAWRPRLPNKEMKLTSVERIGRSQLISGVRWTTRRATERIRPGKARRATPVGDHPPYLLAQARIVMRGYR